MNGRTIRTTAGVLGALVALAAAGTASATPTATCPEAPAGAGIVDRIQGNLKGATGMAVACGVSWTTTAGPGTRLCAAIETNEIDQAGQPVRRETGGCLDGATVEVDPAFRSGHLAGSIPTAAGAIAVDLTVAAGQPMSGVWTSGALAVGLSGGGATSGSMSAVGFGTDTTTGGGNVYRNVVAPTSASPMIVAAPAGNAVGFVTRAMVVAQGGSLQFLNADPTLMHNVYAKKRGADYRPLFSSPNVPALGPDQHDPVAVDGVEKLAPGDYDFYCTIHGQMVGTLTVVPKPIGKVGLS